MEQPGRTCPQCSRVISIRDTVVVRNGRPVHLQCKWPRMLTPDERAILLYYCTHHDVARCVACARSFHLGQLTEGPLADHSYFCPQCRRDLTEDVRAHVYLCAILPAEVRAKAVELRAASEHLVKQSRQLIDQSDVLLREAEVRLDERRQALRRVLSRLS